MDAVQAPQQATPWLCVCTSLCACWRCLARRLAHPRRVRRAPATALEACFAQPAAPARVLLHIPRSRALSRCQAEPRTAPSSVVPAARRGPLQGTHTHARRSCRRCRRGSTHTTANGVVLTALAVCGVIRRRTTALRPRQQCNPSAALTAAGDRSTSAPRATACTCAGASSTATARRCPPARGLHDFSRRHVTP
jgi:hypothetical protein